MWLRHHYDVTDERIRELLDAEIRNNPRRIVKVIDYLVVPSHDDSGAAPAGHEGSVEISRGIRIERIDRLLAERLFDASALRGEDWRPVRQFHAVHAYVREVWADGDDAPGVGIPGPWDDARRIWPTVQLSRLVRDNGVSTEHAVRRVILKGGDEQLIPFGGFETHVVYRLYPREREWLDVDEARQLGMLMDLYQDGQHLPRRIRRGLRRADAITRERYLEDAMPLVVGGLEALLKVGRDYARAQFSQRVPALAAEVGVELSADFCEEVYKDRSALVHGGDVDLSVTGVLDDFGRAFVSLQTTLRQAVRRAIEDPSFASVFAEDATISTRWPATVRGRGGVEQTI